VVESNSLSGAPIIRATVEPDADFQIKVDDLTYVLDNGVLQIIGDPIYAPRTGRAFVCL